MLGRYLKNEKGIALILLALSIIVLFGFGALAVDIGHMYNVKNQLQVAADAAALAGAARLDGTGTVAQPAARAEARKFGARNNADVAYQTVAAMSGYTNGAAVGAPIPVALNSNDANSPTGDIVVGYWSGSSFSPTIPSGGFANAVKVVARRTGAAGWQPQVQSMFAKVLNLLGSNFNFTQISAEAIAAKTKLDLLPIAVNEYWDVDKNNNLWNQKYPQSFMRSVNADGSNNALGGRVFAFLGASANAINVGNMSGFVDVLVRNAYHDGNTSNWYSVDMSSATGGCSPSCESNMTLLGGGISNSVNADKYDINFQMLFTGMPGNLIPPNAVREIIRTSPAFPANNYNTATNHNDPSLCPFATLAYFSTSGVGPGNKKLDLDSDPSVNGLRFWEKYPKGSYLIVMVYDGTSESGLNPSEAQRVTIVGYGVIQVDGYSSTPLTNPSQIKNLETGGIGGKGGNTAYGHAVPHGIVGADDDYIIQPAFSPDTARTPGCDTFVSMVRHLQDSRKYVNVHLVGPGIKYGTTGTNQY